MSIRCSALHSDSGWPSIPDWQPSRSPFCRSRDRSRPSADVVRGNHEHDWRRHRNGDPRCRASGDEPSQMLAVGGLSAGSRQFRLGIANRTGLAINRAGEQPVGTVPGVDLPRVASGRLSAAAIVRHQEPRRWFQMVAKLARNSSRGGRRDRRCLASGSRPSSSDARAWKKTCSANRTGHPVDPS